VTLVHWTPFRTTVRYAICKHAVWPKIQNTKRHEQGVMTQQTSRFVRQLMRQRRAQQRSPLDHVSYRVARDYSGVDRDGTVSTRQRRVSLLGNSFNDDTVPVRISEQDIREGTANSVPYTELPRDTERCCF
jgi:hypothetical protein